MSHINGWKKNSPTVADQTLITKGMVDEIRANVDKTDEDFRDHHGNYGVKYHKVADNAHAGFMSAPDKVIFDEHVQEHTGPEGAAHGVATQARNGFLSSTDKKRIDLHIGYGGTTQHPIVTDDLAGFMSPAQKGLLETIADTYVTKEEMEAKSFKIYLYDTGRHSFVFGEDDGRGNFDFRIPRAPLEAQAGRPLIVDNEIYPVGYTVHSYLYNWSTPYAILGSHAYNEGTNVRAGLRLAGAGTYHRSGTLSYSMTIALIPANSVVWLS